MAGAQTGQLKNKLPSYNPAKGSGTGIEIPYLPVIRGKNKSAGRFLKFKC